MYILLHLFSDSNKQRIISDEGAQVLTPGTKSLLSKQHQIRLERRSVIYLLSKMKQNILTLLQMGLTNCLKLSTRKYYLAIIKTKS